ncbi:MAG TPA: hypothetical protein EYN66_15700, partial [Myxococcales bacterium]|nr:hypothetical protein [Myxococcales bacterium]
MMSIKQHIELLRDQIAAISRRLDSLEEGCEVESGAEKTNAPASLDESSPNFAAYKPGGVPDSSAVQFTMEDEPQSAG